MMMLMTDSFLSTFSLIESFRSALTLNVERYMTNRNVTMLMVQTVIAEPKGEASNRDTLSSPVWIYVCMYICISVPVETPRLCNSPVFSAGAHDNKTLYLATIDHETVQHSTSLLHPTFRLLLTLPIASARATRLLAIPPYWLTSFARRGREHFHCSLG